MQVSLSSVFLVEVVCTQFKLCIAYFLEVLLLWKLISIVDRKLWRASFRLVVRTLHSLNSAICRSSDRSMLQPSKFLGQEGLFVCFFSAKIWRDAVGRGREHF